MQTITVQPIQTAYRIQSIDLLRGLVMIIMALDHVRDYFHASAQIYDPLDLSQTSPVIYLTRWVTHFCAPVFMFLAGTSAYLIGQRKTKKQLSFFLFTRGLWLVFLELTFVYFGWSFNIHFPVSALITIWALGISMIALSGLIYLPFKIVLAIGILIVAGHNSLDNFHVPGNDLKAFIWDELHDPRLLNFYGHIIITGYPVLSWIGIITLGYCFGRFYKKDFNAIKRKKWLLLIGSSAIILFITLRSANIYGDQLLWANQKSGLFTFLSFINVTKYPPSLLYTLITLGPAIIFLAFAEKPLNSFTSFISVYGRVPMFYYLLHIYLIHFLAMIAAQLTGFGWKSMIADIFPQIKGYGFSLVVVYLVWMGVVLALYPLCRWYDKYKMLHKEKWWLSYL
ncbi:MAG TPA: heparan-alpha-glucosaminide N-acetyltransferase domain-containing protein [Chitinophagaceae bacterium]|nr:heparan-alpha-glucosaminide N-acetyltransferase domain-containing protein [Chitinophagaceae bacterium]